MSTEKIHESHEFGTVRELIEWAGDTYSDKTAYSYRRNPADKDIVKVTFNSLRDDVRSFSSELLAMGCQGKKCAVIGKFSYDWALTYFSLLSIGAIVVPLDRDWHACDLADTAKKAGISFLFCDEDIKEKGDEISQTLKLTSPTVYMLASDEENNTDMLTAAGSMKYRKNPKNYENAEIDPEKLALLVYTSGTTGKGKGVMLTQKAILSCIASAVPYIDYGEKTISLLPPHHTYGSSIMFIGHTMIGAEIYISSGLRYLMKEMKEQQPEHLALVPLFLENFHRKLVGNISDQGKDKLVSRMMKLSNSLRHVKIDRRNSLFSALRTPFGGKLRTVISGGAPINPEIMSFFESIGVQVLNGYGITECAPLIAFTRSKNVVYGSVGNVIEIDQIKIDEPNEDGEGEILVKGPNVMLGYYEDEEATKAAFDDEGYFRTGDYGKTDKNGILYITGRKKNLIILSNGKNVYPEEIENELSGIPGVLEVIVYEGKSKKGIAHNAIVAEIFPDFEYCEKNGIEDLKDYFRKKVDNINKTAVPYKKVALVRIRKEEFPKNTLKKILRFKIDTTIE